ncbi:nucleotidyltransferase domain-containing protein [Geminocystis sp. GBBB08]|uniref:nucleotidyltransferase family protein n=1 Tax=Geminocystis sp. GBBB08 TaxID=2604140 RepID=UPI0027E2597C|nr:nucleotidyltransferase domain-containing protein [Geminocystis sp. GBBB08]MBL1210293.1 nucleotidyltransferase domain-containing protein [Geminocystis sp. GBBB08]
MDTFDYSSARMYLQEKQNTLKAKRFELWKKAQQDAAQIIEMIVQKYKPKRIIQWGSVLESKHFSEASDIDLAIEGVSSMEFMDIFADAENMTTFSLDLIRWENIHSSFQKIIFMKGKIVYEKR